MTRDKLFSMRCGDFSFNPISNIFDPNKDYFPYRFHIVKWQGRSCFAIGELKWNEHEEDWEFESIGTRYLKYSTLELNQWILDFCNKYEIRDGEIMRREDWHSNNSKDIAKRPYSIEKEYYYGLPCFHECPHCCSGVIKEFEYCPHCGQRLDWSE